MQQLLLPLARWGFLFFLISVMLLWHVFVGCDMLLLCYLAQGRQYWQSCLLTWRPMPYGWLG
jgi:hypothetical protein